MHLFLLMCKYAYFNLSVARTKLNELQDLIPSSITLFSIQATKD